MRPRGYAVATDRETGRIVKEADPFTCGHCNCIVHAKPKAMLGGCRMCHSLICGPCEQRGGCTPWEKRMERAEARDRSRRSMGL